MAGSPLSWAASLAAAATLLAGPGARVGAATGELCDIHIDTRMSLYMVTVDGYAWEGKRYLTYEDALGLRDVLIANGACERVAGPRLCELKLLAAGEYAILRDGVNFDPHAQLRTLDAARAYARKLVERKLCKMGKRS